MKYLCLGLALIPWYAQAASKADDLFARVSPSVVSVLSLGPAGRVESQGSGVVVGVARVITNCHVVRDAKAIQVRQGEALLDARWHLADQARDLCLLDVAKLDAPAVALRESSSLAVGERVFAVGNPLGFGLAISEGLISHLDSRKASARLYSTASTSHGSSGGGLFDENGKLVGITTASLVLGQNFNIAVPAEWIAEVDKRGVAPPPPLAPPPPEPAWIRHAEQLAEAGRWADLEAWAIKWRDAMPDSPEPYRFLGGSLTNQGRSKAAIEPLRAALQRHPCHFQVLVHLGSALHASGDKTGSDKALQQATECNPSAGMPYGEMARLRLIDGNLEEADQLIQKALMLSPGDPWSWGLLGQVKERRGDAAAAGRAYQVAVRQQPGNAEYQNGLARALATSGQGGRARQVMAQSPATAGNSAATWLQLGIRELQRKHYSDAEHALRKALELDPRLVEAMISLGMLLAETGRASESASMLKNALAIRPDEPDALIALAELRIRENDPAQAKELLQRAIAQKPVRPQALRLLGKIRFDQRDFAGALEIYRQLTSSEKPQASDWVAVGKALINLGRLSEAEAPLREAEKLDPQDIDTLNTLAALHGRRGNAQQALADIERLLAKDSSVAMAWSAKGFALLQLGRLDESIAALETAVRLQPDLANAWINLGQALLAKKQLGKAISALEKAIQLAPLAVDARLYLAQAYAQSGQYDKSRAQLQVLRQAQPDSLPVYAMSITLDLVQGRSAEARDSFLQMRARNPIAAMQFRNQSVSRGVPGAASLPE